MTIDLTPLINAAEAIVANHALGGGAYRRWNWVNGSNTDLGINPYGCADAANVLYTIGRFPRDPAERAGWIASLQGLQDAATGLFNEETHHPIHTTAHCIAALELFDARPLHRLSGLDAHKTPAGVRAFLSSLDWKGNPWRESHRGAGLFAALAITEEVDDAWIEAYFDWLWQNTDPATGLFGGTNLPRVKHNTTETMVPHMAGTFHYMFNMEWAKQPKRHADKLIDACIDMLEENQFPLGQTSGFAEIDWFYCMNRCLRQNPHRFEESRAAILKLATRYCDYLLALDAATDNGLNDLHTLFGILCALAEVQQTLPGLLKTPRPLKLVLDRRPFI